MIFKLHFGLWYGGLVGIIPFMFNYAREYSGASATQHGLLYTLLPFVSLVAKPIVGSFADRYSAHHHCLLFFVFTTIVGYGSLAVYPFFPELVQNHKDLLWTLYCLAGFIGNTSMSVVNSIGDSLAMHSCKRNNLSYGEYRLWGPVGFGIFGAIWGVANEIPWLPKYTPGILTLILIHTINILLLAFWFDRDEFRILQRSHQYSENQPSNVHYGSTANHSDPKQQASEEQELKTEGLDKRQDPPTVSWFGRMQLLGQLVKQEKSFLAYVTLFTFCGILTGVHWQFFFGYLDGIARNSQQSFSTLSTFIIPAQALGGELIFFLLSGAIIRKLGVPFTMVICLLSFSARYLLYAFVIPRLANAYWILLVELLQGPAFGLMYCALTHQASYYSARVDTIVAQRSQQNDKKLINQLHTTLQGVLGAAFEGLGLALGALIGGFLYDLGPIIMWRIAGFTALFVTFICSICAIFSIRTTPVEQMPRVTSDMQTIEQTC